MAWRDGQYVTIQRTGKGIKLKLLAGRILFWPSVLMFVFLDKLTTFGTVVALLVFLTACYLLGTAKVARWWRHD